MAPSQTALVFTFDYRAEYHLLLHRPRPAQPAAALGIMGIAVAVILHEASDLFAVAYGLRVAELRG
ncbi:hypothetical protein RJ53_08760 [Methanocalculus chunghsingensis]|uniref:Uncharacterized protein n=1 Tax=Methanocalculus chunghsingensis TaxID=156457 RepID=A0A8J7WBA2_9EURY|nr:hypothetical protein [Methanocalculus chunghsingensis]MBR1369573.1 hypothetical protein [Methanocalculus chunghsingensis]